MFLLLLRWIISWGTELQGAFSCFSLNTINTSLFSLACLTSEKSDVILCFSVSEMASLQLLGFFQGLFYLKFLSFKYDMLFICVSLFSLFSLIFSIIVR